MSSSIRSTSQHRSLLRPAVAEAASNQQRPGTRFSGSCVATRDHRMQHSSQCVLGSLAFIYLRAAGDIKLGSEYSRPAFMILFGHFSDGFLTGSVNDTKVARGSESSGTCTTRRIEAIRTIHCRGKLDRWHKSAQERSHTVIPC